MAYGLTAQVGWLGLSVGGHLALSLNSSNEPDELSCNGTINIAIVVIIRSHRSTTYVDAAYCYRPSSVVCRSVTLVNRIITAEPTAMLFALRTRANPRHHVFDGGPDLPIRRGNFEAKGGPL